MSGRRKTKTIQVGERLSKSPGGGGYASARKLSKEDLGGVIFGCKKDTMAECLSKQLFGLPSSHFHYVRNIEPGLTLFLFNFSNRKMHGIYEAASPGEMDIDPYAWTNDGKERTGFPAQVRVCFRKQCQPISENQFKKVIGDNYYKRGLFWFELNHAQTEGLLGLFLASDQSMNTMTTPAASSDDNLFTSATTKCNLLANSYSAFFGAVEPSRVNDFPLLSDKCIQHGIMDTTSTTTTTATTTLDKEFKETCSYRDNQVEGNVVVSHSDVILHQEKLNQTLSKQQFDGERLESGEVRRHMIENLSGDPSCSTFLPKTCIDYRIAYVPRNINEGSMFPGKPSVSPEKEKITRSSLYNGNTELVQIVEELKERVAASEKKQFETELEMQQLINVVKDSEKQIQQLKYCLKELEAKLV